MASQTNRMELRAFCRIREENRAQSRGSGCVVKTTELSEWFDQSSVFFLVTTRDVLTPIEIKNTLKRGRRENFTILVDIGSTETKQGTETVKLHELLDFIPPGGENALEEVVNEISGLVYINLGKFQSHKKRGTTTCTVCEKPLKFGQFSFPSPSNLTCHLLQEAKPSGDSPILSFAPLDYSIQLEDTDPVPFICTLQDSRGGTISSRREFEPHVNPLGAMVTDGKGHLVGFLCCRRIGEIRFLPNDLSRKKISENSWVQAGQEEKVSVNSNGFGVAMVSGYNVTPPLSSTSSPVLKRDVSTADEEAPPCNSLAKEEKNARELEDEEKVKAGNVVGPLKTMDAEVSAVDSDQETKSKEISEEEKCLELMPSSSSSSSVETEVEGNVEEPAGPVEGAVGGEPAVVPNLPVNKLATDLDTIRTIDSGIGEMDTEDLTYKLQSGLDLRDPGAKPKKPNKEAEKEEQENDEGSDNGSAVTQPPDAKDTTPPPEVNRYPKDYSSTWSPDHTPAAKLVVDIPPMGTLPSVGTPPNLGSSLTLVAHQELQMHHSYSETDLNRVQPYKVRGDDSVCKLWNVSKHFETRHFKQRLCRLLDTEYSYDKIECWREVAKGMAIPPDAYELFARTTLHSPSERLFEYLDQTDPDMTVNDLMTSLKNKKAFNILEDSIKCGICSETTFMSDVLNDHPEIIGKLSLALDSWPNNWEELSKQLKIRDRNIRKFSLPPGFKSPTAELFNAFLPARKPWLKVKDIRDALENLTNKKPCRLLETLNDDLSLADLTNNLEVMDALEEQLDDGDWKPLAVSLKLDNDDIANIPPITPIEPGPTEKIFKYLECTMPGQCLVEQFIIILGNMKRYDCLELIAEHVEGGVGAINGYLTQAYLPKLRI